MCAYTDPQNIASARVLEKCGFSLEGCLRDHVEVKGRRRNSLVFSLLAPEWRARTDS
jgi:RimJ/RimL family protein N-acetyltransferase